MRNKAPEHVFRARGKDFPLGRRSYIVGILNLTPDSFSDGGNFIEESKALEHGIKLLDDGADILDIGAESSRPGAESVGIKEEKKRIIPVLRKLKKLRPESVISIDSTKPEVAEAAVTEGAEIINCIYAMRDPRIAEIAARSEAGLVLMHMRGTPETMQRDLEYTDLMSEIRGFLLEAAASAVKKGVTEDRLIIDPGIGFSKDTAQNIEIVSRINALMNTGYPVLAGHSRKSFIGDILGGIPPEQRAWGTAAVTAKFIIDGVDFIRVHDVRAACHLRSVIERIIL